eukprot:1139015-Pelagomonas_calceolata.AAC.4
MHNGPTCAPPQPRVLLNAASRGLTEVAEDTIEQMRSSDLPPGPRAYHALVFSYVRANLPYEALDTAARAADEGKHNRICCTVLQQATKGSKQQ